MEVMKVLKAVFSGKSREDVYSMLSADEKRMNVMRGREDIDELIDRTDNIPYMDYCRLLSVLYWNL